MSSSRRKITLDEDRQRKEVLQNVIAELRRKQLLKQAVECIPGPVGSYLTYQEPPKFCKTESIQSLAPSDIDQDGRPVSTFRADLQ